MAAINLSRILGLFSLRDGTDPTRKATVNAAGALATSAIQLGEVQASPTAYTVLDRLKAIATALTGLVVNGAGIAGTPAGGVMSVQGVSSATPIPVSASFVTSAAATVANTGNLSDAVDCRAAKPVAILFPSSLNNLANLTGIQVSYDGSTYYSLLNVDGTTFTSIPLTVSSAIPLSLLNTQFINYLKLQFGTNANASTVFRVVLAP